MKLEKGSSMVFCALEFYSGGKRLAEMLGGDFSKNSDIRSVVLNYDKGKTFLRSLNGSNGQTFWCVGCGKRNSWRFRSQDLGIFYSVQMKWGNEIFNQNYVYCCSFHSFFFKYLRNRRDFPFRNYLFSKNEIEEETF